MRKILLLILLILALPLVSADHDDIQYSVQNDILRINDDLIIIYNATIHQDENVGLFIEYDDVKEYLLNVTTISTITNQKLEYNLNNTGTYYIGTFFTYNNTGVTTFQYYETIEVKNSLPDSWSISLLVLTFAFLIGAIVIHPILYLMTILTLIGAITSLIFTYSYILSPILIGVVSIIYIGLLVLVYEIFKQLL